MKQIKIALTQKDIQLLNKAKNFINKPNYILNERELVKFNKLIKIINKQFYNSNQNNINTHYIDFCKLSSHNSEPFAPKIFNLHNPKKPANKNTHKNTISYNKQKFFNKIINLLEELDLI